MNECMDAAERRGLRVSSGGAFVVGCMGLVFAQLTDSNAILLDGAFNLVYFVVGLLTLKVSRMVHRQHDVRFPVGYSFFEPLINGVKGVLILGITAMALFDAVSALWSGGRSIVPGMATLYGAFAAIVCWGVVLVLKRQCRQTSSPLLRADAESWVVNAAISSGVLLTFVLITLIDRTQWRGVVPYVDPLLVVIVCGVTINVPVKLAWRSLMELINRAPPEGVYAAVERTVRAALVELETESLVVRVLEPGRTRLVWVHVVLPRDLDIRVEGLDAYRRQVDQALAQHHAQTLVDIVFTKNPEWGAQLQE